MTSILTVIVNYRTPALVIDCLASLELEIGQNPGARVVVVDNASGDGSDACIADAIARYDWSGWARLLVSPANGGFAHGNNFAIAPALASVSPPDYVWLLNPDTRVRPGAMRALSRFLATHPRTGIVGSALEEGDGTPWPYAFRFPTLLGEVERGARFGPVTRLLRQHAVPIEMNGRPAEVDWVSGASMMIRREVFERIGLMDEGYFLYFEETDFCLQARRAGWHCHYVPAARVLHIAGQSTGVTGQQAVARRVPGYWFDSRRRYFAKNHGRAYAIAADIAWAAAHLLWRLRRRLQALPDPDPKGLLLDFLRHSALLRPAG